MKTITKAMGGCAVWVLATGCLDHAGDDEFVEIVPSAWDTEQPAAADTQRVFTPTNLSHIAGHGSTFLNGEAQLTLLHGAHALDVLVDVGEIGALGINSREFGTCMQTLTFELGEVRVLSGEESVRVKNVEASTFELEPTGTGTAVVQFGGTLIASVESEAGTETNARGRGRGGWNDEAQQERCEGIFGEDSGLGIVYRVELDVREATRMAFTYPEECAREGGDGMRMIEGGQAMFWHSLHDATADLSYTFNRSWDLDFDIDVIRGQDITTAYESGQYASPITLAASGGVGELELEERELGARARVEVIAPEAVDTFELGFWYATRGYERATDGGTFWTYDRPDAAELLISLEGMRDGMGRGICGDALEVDISTRTPDVCQIVEGDGVGLYTQQQLMRGVDFTRKGTCTLDVNAPEADGGHGLSRTYTFTLE